MIVFREGMCRTSERTGEMMREQKDFRQTLGNTTTPREIKNQAHLSKFKFNQLQLHIWHITLYFFLHLDICQFLFWFLSAEFLVTKILISSFAQWRLCVFCILHGILNSFWNPASRVGFEELAARLNAIPSQGWIRPQYAFQKESPHIMKTGLLKKSCPQNDNLEKVVAGSSIYFHSH